MKASATSLPEPQPNVFGDRNATGFPWVFWVLIALTGVGAGLGGAALMALLRLTQHLAWSYASGDFLDAVSKSTPSHRMEVMLAAGVLVALARWSLRRPTGGHGGEVSAAIWFRSGTLPVFRTLAGAVVSIVVVGLGAALGREGAPKQVGALWGSLLAKWSRVSSSQRRLLAACGGGAGLAAVYNVPLGGALFTMEILLGTLSLSLVLPALLASGIAVGVSWLFLPNQPTYSFSAGVFSPIALAAAPLLGLIAGLASTIYLKWMSWADARKPHGVWRVLVPIIVFALLGLASIPFPQLLGNGKNVTQLAFFDQLGLPLLTILLLLRPLASGGCLACGTPGGLFTPTLTFGALLGGAFGHAWNAFLPGESVAVYAVIGAGAVFAASLKGPFSAMVLLFELTHQVTPLVVPLMLAIAVATAVATYFDPRSIYSARIHEGKALARSPQLAPPAGVVPDPDRIISAATPYAEVLRRWLKLAPHQHPFYVVDETAALIGEIDAERLAQAEKFAAPLETASADDLILPTRSLASTLSAEEMERQVGASPVRPLPVIDPVSGRVLGFFPGNAQASSRPAKNFTETE
jgi:CIC family chloride channel protein